MNTYPDCTLVTGCYNLNSMHRGARTAEELIQAMKAVLEMPCYLVIYCDRSLGPAIITARAKNGLSKQTLVHEVPFDELWCYQFLEKVKENRIQYHPTADERTSAETHLLTCNKFDFVLQAMEENPFSTSKFGWIDSVSRENMTKICENYNHSILYSALTATTEKFHIQVLNVCDKKYKKKENKREYYQQYRWVVCGSFFTCGLEVGKKILNRLKENVRETTELGYGHGEEMFYLEILDEFYDDIVRSYGDYGQILNNFARPTRNIWYIVQCIVKGYSQKSYHRECYDCCRALINEIECYSLNVPYDMMMDIYFYYYMSAFYYKRHEARGIADKIRDMCYVNPYFKAVYESNRDFYGTQLSYA